MAPLNVLSVGASRNIGYLLLFAFLVEQGSTVTFLLRSPSAFDGDATIQKYIKSGHARLVKGDASIEADTQRAWDEAGVVDALVFTVGTYPSFSLTKGLVQKPADLCTRCMLNFVVLSSTGLGPAAHKALPLAFRPLYGWALVHPHEDKKGMERVVSHCAGWTWDDKIHGKVSAAIMGDRWMERKGLPAKGTLHHAVIIRAGFLTDGECVADKVEGTKKSYRDAAHLVVDVLTRRRDEFDNTRLNVTY
ncbi:hypothetical protein K438DRAFT_1809979 [Mycena galopus ATCC 62051]|nr:hypothetical protein K438DRAFT_1809979 [Mycena galopus ATCC 62051]